ncbi:hypothetical protein GCM10010967_20760 [Dyadobacter beijingensis]|uniref:PepSY domain-containing protein n=1 Tax=Dyadobacter beijingensis TaxID=365489 RepID=A0ABQ2HRS7_9BACT|nr:hypothetical protein [Dyadobacter beijingensis]GGM87992.1 hypothetical protein GCM10010967_20760 [Dyadobacter beijingensis]
MKKLIVSALALTLISFASAEAQTANQTTEKHAEHQQAQKAASSEEKVAVKPEDLPEGIKKTIKSEEFSGWTVKKAFLVTESDKTQYYELQVANGKENARVKLDKDGRNVG